MATKKATKKRSTKRKTSPGAARKSTTRKSTKRKKAGGRKYGPAASKKVGGALHEAKRGKLRSGSGKKVTSKKQAIAIGLSQARKRGAKVPKRKTAGKR